MNSPVTALAWELWTRNRRRLIILASVLLAFAVVYPPICAWVGVDLKAPDALDQFFTLIPPGTAPSFYKLLRILTAGLLICGPLASMLLSLFYVVWMFTSSELHPKSKNILAFSARVFVLPVSTAFISAWFMLSGMAALAALYFGWTQLVPLSRLALFNGFQSGLLWLTLLVATQALLWSLNSWPKTRAILAVGLLCGFLGLPGFCLDHPAFYQQYGTLALCSILLLSAVVAHLGLVRMRHGRWQGWSWRSAGLPSPGLARPRTAAPREKFTSAARAQFWFEWRKSAGALLFAVATIAWVSLLITAIYTALFGSLKKEIAQASVLCLAGLPAWVFAFYGLGGEQNVTSFNFLRPLSSGKMVMIKFAALALSATLSCVAVLPAIAALPFLTGPLPADFGLPSPLKPLLPVLPLFLVFVTWGFAAGNLSFGMGGRSWPGRRLPVIATCAILAAVPLLVYLQVNAAFRQDLLHSLPAILVSLVAAKILLAVWAFRVSLQRNLLGRSAMIKYLVIWNVFAAIFIAPVVVVLSGLGATSRHLFPISFAIILLMPLARIALAPVALAFGRHHRTA